MAELDSAEGFDGLFPPGWKGVEKEEEEVVAAPAGSKEEKAQDWMVPGLGVGLAEGRSRRRKEPVVPSTQGAHKKEPRPKAYFCLGSGQLEEAGRIVPLERFLARTDPVS